MIYLQGFLSSFGSAWSSGINQIQKLSGDLFGGVIDWVVDLLNGCLLGVGELLGNWLYSVGLTLEIPVNVFDVLKEITYGIGYILPIGKLMPIVNFFLAFYFAKIVFAVYHLVASTVVKRVKVKV